MKLKLKRDKGNNKKNKKLGDFGENLAVKLLEESGFSDIQNLNSKKIITHSLTL